MSVQAIRFLAAVSVVIAHACFYTGVRFDERTPAVDVLGSLGVWSFFTISGFVMVLVTDQECSRSGRVDWRRFALKRIVRVVPLYWLMTTVKLLALVQSASLLVNTAADPWTIIRSYLFIPSFNEAGTIQPVWGVGWTLIYEMAFYLVVAIALIARIDPIVAAAPVLIGAATLWLARPQDGSALWLYADPMTLYFLAGMVIARWARTRPWLAVLVLVGLGSVQSALHTVRDAALTLQPLLVFLAISGVLLGAVLGEERLRPHIPRWVLVGGTASYSLYLAHPLIAPLVPLMAATTAPSAPWLAVVVVTVATAVLAAPLWYRFVETPLTRLVSRAVGLTRAPRTASQQIVG
jgi:peptidoglycan/LPS O-acetylase OafA/YrhL